MKWFINLPNAIEKEKHYFNQNSLFKHCYSIFTLNLDKMKIRLGCNESEI
jgi:hypothetical protein